MKKLLVFSNAFMLMLLILSNTVNNKKDSSPTAFHDIKLGVDPELARDMVSNFKGDIWNGRKVNNSPYLDSRSVWFSVYKLKKFIKDIEDKTPPGCRTDDFDLGIRIYFGDYPASQNKWASYSKYTTDHKLPDEYKGLHSVLLVPTLWNSDDQFNYDFDPREFNSIGKCTPKPIKDVMDNLITLKTNSGAPGQRIMVSPGDSNSIPRNMAYMIMPDNLDNRRFQITPNNTREKGGPTLNNDEYSVPPDPSFANAGTLIPPPYPDPNSFKLRPGIRMFHVPFSGASFMRWVDGTNICGWNTETLGKKEVSQKTDGIKVQ